MSVAGRSVQGMDEMAYPDPGDPGDPADPRGRAEAADAGSVDGVSGDSVVLDCLARIESEIEFAQQAGLSAHNDGQAREGVRVAHRLRARLEAVYLHLLRDLAGRPGAVAGARPDRGAETFLVHALNLAAGRAAADVRAARVLDPVGAGITPESARRPDPEAASAMALFSMAAALAEGAITSNHVDVALRCLRDVPEHLLVDRDENGLSGRERIDEFLTEHARRVPPGTLARIARELVAVLDPDGDSSFDPLAHRRRRLDYATDAAGMLVGSFALDPVSGVRFRAAVEAIVRDQRGDQAHAVGQAPPGHDQPDLPVRDERTAGQRRADALAHLVAGRGVASGAGVGAEILVVATADQIAAATGEPDADAPDVGAAGPPGADPADADRVDAHRAGAGLATDSHGTALSPGALQVLLCTAALTGVVTGNDGVVLTHGRTKRLATRGQLRALAARDRGCIVPGCTLSLDRCQAHHITWWRHGGATDLDNLALLCESHHAAVHTGHWRISVVDRLPYVIAPYWADPTQTPRRNTFPAAEHAARALGQGLYRRRRRQAVAADLQSVGRQPTLPLHDRNPPPGSDPPLADTG